ncbi:uncharacterized protein JCM6883_005171 [Sporobolomyces salmoneus]|uniref:uncharacterized protein n=1 Tax=Sporobolomyces salmoneus TaxID=183962 RepID=UPI00317DCE57
MADPAFRGFVESTLDALLVFEGCKRGYLPKISRRLQDYEKKALVVSGAIFVFDEEETGIKRWTDGLSWSPSRTLGNFLVYRELDKKTPSNAHANKEEEEEPPIEKNSTTSTNAPNRLMGGLTSKSDPLDDANDLAPVPSTSTSRPPNVAPRQRSLSEVAGLLQIDRARERALVGSLTSSYRFRSDGLVKKTISLSGLHLVAYYRLDDVTSGRLRTPSSHAELMSLEVSPGFLTPSLFRMPPVVEVGLDGQIRYKGESDTPISPLTRSGSSQGFPTPNLNQSRPATSDPYSTSAPPPPHLTQSLGPRPPSRDFSAAPGSPRRGATATVRSANRFDPYGAGRYSPNATAYSSTSSYPFNHQVPPSQPSPNRATFSPIGETVAENHRRESSGSDGRSTAQMMMENTGSTAQPGGWYGQSQGHGQGPGPGSYQDLPNGGRGRASFQGEISPNYYRPRQAIPYGTPTPNEAISSGPGVFAYNPPSTLPPGPLLRRASEGMPSNGYSHQQSYQHRPVSQQYQPSPALDPTSPNSSAASYDHYEHSNSFVVTTAQQQQHDPSSYHPCSTRESSQQLSHLPSASSARNSPIPPSSTTAWHSLDVPSTSGPPLQDDNGHLAQASNPRSLQSPIEPRGVYANSSIGPSSNSTYVYSTLNQPNGLVVGFHERNALQGVPSSEGAATVGLYQNEDVYNHQLPPVEARPLDHRQTSQSQFPPHPSLGLHLSYPTDSTSSSTTTPVPPEQIHHTYQNNDWHSAPKFAPVNGSLGVQPNSGWWSPGDPNCSESFWQGQAHGQGQDQGQSVVKKEYS